MRPAELVRGLADFEGRGAGTNAERRAALWLSQDLQNGPRQTSLETFWCRPNLALAHAWHALIGIVGSLLSISHPEIGGGLLVAALLSVLADSLTGYSLGRRLTREHASQNVVNRGAATDGRVRLIITSNYDAGRGGFVYRDLPRRVVATCRRVAGGGRFTPGWVGWLAIMLIWLVVVAILRHGGSAGTWIGVLQLIPTVSLVLELALLLEHGGSEFSPAAGDNASGTGVALALARALDAAPPRHLQVEVVLQGAGDGQMIGLTRHLRGRRRELTSTQTIVLGIGPCGAGQPRWWVGDGSLIPLRYLARLRRIAASVADPETGSEARPYRGRGVSPAFPARMAGLPAISVGALDERGLAPRSHQPRDVADAVDPGAMDAVLEFALTLVDAIDADLRISDRSAARPAAA
ncbi:MAG: M28 family peptidase [Solirubrobacteraceae bacterium]